MSYLTSIDEEDTQARINEQALQNPFDPNNQPPKWYGGLDPLTLSEQFETGAVNTAEALGGSVLGLAGTAADILHAKDLQKQIEEQALDLNTQASRWRETLQPNPNDLGFAGKVVGGFTQAVPSILLGGVPGIGLTSAFTSEQSLWESGVDQSDATLIGTGVGLTQSLAAAVPFFGKSLLGKLGSGAITNTAFGAGSDEAQKLALDHLGYDDLAKEFAVKPESLASDFLTGLLFGAQSHYFGGARERDALNTLKQDNNLREKASQGRPADPVSETLHAEAMNKSIDDLIADRPVDVPRETGDARFTPDPKQEARTEDAVHAAEAVAKEQGIKVASPDDLKAVPDLLLTNIGGRSAVPPSAANETPFETASPAPKAEEAPSISKPEIIKTPTDVAKELGLPEPKVEFPDGQVLGYEAAKKRLTTESEETDNLAKATQAVADCYLETL